MSTMTRIDPPLPVETPKGEGLAHFVVDYGLEHNLMWVVFLNDSGECWSFQNPLIRICKNFSWDRPKISEIKNTGTPWKQDKDSNDSSKS